MTNLLFVCSRNLWRSRTAEDLYRDTPGLSVKSCGTASSAVRKVSQALLDWADLVVCMERKHRDRIEQRFGREALSGAEVIVLDIPDEYRRGDLELIGMLRDELDHRLLNEDK